MRWLTKWWWLVLAVLVVLGFSRLRFNVEVLDLLPSDLPSVQGLKLYQEHFANARELIITLRAPTAETAEALTEALAIRLQRQTNLVTEVTWQSPWMAHPDQAAELVAYLWFNQPPKVFESLTNRLAPDQRGAVLAEAREQLATSLSPMNIARRAFDPYDLLTLPTLTNFSGGYPEQGQQTFSSADGTFRILFVQARPALAGYRACADWLAKMRRTVAETQAQKLEWRETTVRYTGRPVFVAEIASSMQRDLSRSVAGVAAIIAGLFWLMHRRWLPMLWLLCLLGLILAATLGLGGLLFGTINVVSMGFAAVLLGLAVDYAVVHYQEALAHPQLSVPEVRRLISPSIIWAALTTIAAFLVLNLGGLPGLAQLGTLVAIGISLAALVMVVAFLPLLFPERRHLPPGRPPFPWRGFLFAPPPPPVVGTATPPMRYVWGALWVTGLVVLAAVLVILARGLPGVDRSGDALRPQHSEAESALKEVAAAVGVPQEPLWTIATGTNVPAVSKRLDQEAALLAQARSKGVINDYVIPAALWPQVTNQDANRPTALWLAGQEVALRDAALRAGFKTNALLLTDELLRTWRRLGNGSGVQWPTNQMSQWLLKRFVANATNQWLALGLVYPATNHTTGTALVQLAAEFKANHLALSGWPLLGTATLERVKGRLGLVVFPMVGLVLASLWLAFRNVREVLLSVSVLLLGGLCVLTLMALNGWSWNLLNLMALPLILGTGVDYGIFIQLGLRRHRGDVTVVRRSIGRALLLCGGTAIAGFGGLAWSDNLGMASLGKICASGIAANMLISIYLLPAWWCRIAGRAETPAHGASNHSELPTEPSTFYRAWLWRLGLLMTRMAPLWLLQKFCLLLAAGYYRLNGPRRRVVVANLLPVVNGDQRRAATLARRLYQQFALKLLDLWRYENGIHSAIEFGGRIENQTGNAAQPRGMIPGTVPFTTLIDTHRTGRGVLLISPHLGNWEAGALLFKRQGIPLLIITQAEPGKGLTEMRQDAREQWGIETLVLRNDAFAFVELIRRLQEGAAVALLVDRPPSPRAVEVELFHRPFQASIAPAELARATGCALFGGLVVRDAQGGYVTGLLPEFQYDRKKLGHHEARRELTQQILRAFEPWIRQHLDQWFHFVPIWPRATAVPTENNGGRDRSAAKSALR